MANLPEKILTLLTHQLHDELASSNNYLAMAAFFERGAFKGFARWMKAQALEEHTHAMRFYDYLTARNATVIIAGVGAPKTEYKAPLEVFKAALASEVATSAAIHKIYDAAQAEKDFATCEMLNWFLKEQVEEEDQTTELVDRVELSGSDISALLQLDHEAGERK